ncbi:hypothetical protein Tco_0038850 [Tanacetum coccineum]
MEKTKKLHELEDKIRSGDLSPSPSSFHTEPCVSLPDGLNFKVNGHCVKHFFRGDLPPKEVQDLHTLPKDD